MSYGKDFIKRYKGKWVDVDGFPAVQPYQCYDLWMQFMYDNYDVSRNIIIGPSGFAKDIWKSFDALGLDNYFTKSKTPKVGDWVIYDDSAIFPQSHVAMVAKVHSNSKIDIFGQNQAGKPQGTVITVGTQGVLGYLRPKEGDMLTEKGLIVLRRHYTGKDPSKAELKKYVGKVTFDEMRKRVMSWPSFKNDIERAKTGKLDPVAHLPGSLRGQFKRPEDKGYAKVTETLYRKK